MKFFKIIIVFIISLLFCPILLPVGFAAGTLVKVPGGYALIEKLQPGSLVYSITQDGNASIQRVKSTISYFASQGVGFAFEDDFIICLPNQKFFLPQSTKWEKAKKTTLQDVFASGQKHLKKIHNIHTFNQEIQFFDIQLEDIHAFCVSTKDIVVHNFANIGIGFALAWGAGKITFEGLWFGIGIIGCWISTVLFNGSKPKITISNNNNCNQNNFIYNCPDPDNDDDECKKKHPHGHYEESPKHHPNARGNISPAPKNGQEVLNKSFEIEATVDRIGLESNKIIMLRETSKRIFHGYIIDKWHTLSKNARKALLKNGYKINPKTGKIKI